MRPIFLFLVLIPDVYAKSRSLYTKFSVLLSKWPDFSAKFLVWVRTRESRPVHPLCGVSHARSALRKTSGRGGSEWASLRRCAKTYFGARNFLRQSQSQTQLPVCIPDLKGNWNPIYADNLVVKPRDCDCDLVVNPTLNVQNWFLHFCSHELT